MQHHRSRYIAGVCSNVADQTIRAIQTIKTIKTI
jgi:hypothetical protein